MKNKDMIKKLLGVRYNMRGQYKQLSDALNKNKPMHFKTKQEKLHTCSSMVNENGIKTQH